MMVRIIILTINISSLAFLFLIAILFAAGLCSFDNFKICSLICSLIWFAGTLTANWLKKEKEG
ncbi:MAG: hypothetical protein ISS19_10180 [Bacteroidales bacterium]|nr:hypothetical protein [Bacteroidales bacterium]